MFEAIEFNGTFRSYQQEILDRADEYLADKKINIVAAPGSGKTILGLELIRRLGKPCIIRSMEGKVFKRFYGCGSIARLLRFKGYPTYYLDYLSGALFGGRPRQVFAGRRGSGQFLDRSFQSD